MRAYASPPVSFSIESEDSFGWVGAIFRCLSRPEAPRIPESVAQAIFSRQHIRSAAKEFTMVQAAGCLLLTCDNRSTS